MLFKGSSGSQDHLLHVSGWISRVPIRKWKDLTTFKPGFDSTSTYHNPSRFWRRVRPCVSMPASQARPRPWIPAERPGDTSYTPPVIYHGSDQLESSDSDISAEDEEIFPTKLAAQARLNQLEAARIPIRFRSSQALRDDSLNSSPEGQLYKQYQASQDPKPRRHKSAQNFRR